LISCDLTCAVARAFTGESCSMANGDLLGAPAVHGCTPVGMAGAPCFK
jgi:hypothetical protein